MPTVSKKQEKFMQAVANNPKFAKAAGVPQSVGKEFTKSGGGMPVKPVTESKSRLRLLYTVGRTQYRWSDRVKMDAPDFLPSACLSPCTRRPWLYSSLQATELYGLTTDLRLYLELHEP